jgi:hypothetical protein
MSANQKSAATTGRGTTAKGRTMRPTDRSEETPAKKSIMRAIPIGRPISDRLYTELKKKAVTTRLASKKGQEDLPS